MQEIDVGMLSPPRPRTIFLEPISKRTRRRKTPAVEKSTTSLGTDINDLASEADGSVATEDSGRDRHSESRGGGSGPIDSRSEISGESGRSASTAMSSGRGDFAQLSQVGSTLASSARQQVVDDKTITATIELLRGGCLPGETVPIRVTVQHIKRMKSMTGVIVTLFRQGKIDSSPAASLFARDTSGRNPYVLGQQSDSAYPRSRTGLGGLSLSSTSSTSMFRKDLDQNAAPLIIDPATLQASVTVSVRLPDDAFPTIKGVPGDMISFKYQVEVIVDLGGRLSAQMQGGRQSMSRANANSAGNGDQGSNPFASPWGSNVADTSQVRRHKGVISVSLETVVGTTDSSKVRLSAASNGLAKTRTIRIADREDDEIIRPEAATTPTPYINGHSLQNRSATPGAPLDYTSPPPHPSDAPQSSWPGSSSNARDYAHANGTPSEAAPSYIPPPQVADEASMTEKERIRQAETRLLPSQPPTAGGPSSSSSATATATTSASAPPRDDDDIYAAEDTPRLGPIASPAPAATSDDDAVGPSAPTVEEVAAGRPTDDKQELERRRLMEEASAPPEFPDDMQSGAGPLQREAVHNEEPSAPALDVDDEYEGYGVGAGSSSQGGGGGGGGGSTTNAEQLPAYER